MHAGIANQRFPLKVVAGKTFPAFPAYAQPTILRLSGKRPMHRILVGFVGYITYTLLSLMVSSCALSCLLVILYWEHDIFWNLLWGLIWYRCHDTHSFTYWIPLHYVPFVIRLCVWKNLWVMASGFFTQHWILWRESSVTDGSLPQQFRKAELWRVLC